MSSAPRTPQETIGAAARMKVESRDTPRSSSFGIRIVSLANLSDLPVPRQAPVHSPKRSTLRRGVYHGVGTIQPTAVGGDHPLRARCHADARRTDLRRQLAVGNKSIAMHERCLLNFVFYLCADQCGHVRNGGMLKHAYQRQFDSESLVSPKHELCSNQ